MLYLIANYGIYADKHKIIYTIRGADTNAERSEGVFAKLPEGWYAYENCYGDSLIKDPEGVIRKIDELLTSDGTYPVLAWYEDGVYHRITLELAETEE